MFETKEPPIVISVGGSLIFPDDKVDAEFIKNLNSFIRRHVEKGRRFFLIAGGGKICRIYQNTAKEVIGDLKDVDIDWLGIHATHLNAHLLRTVFYDIAHPRIIENYDKKLSNWKEPVVIGAGWKPGWSTDYDSVMLARDYGAKLIINLSNIDWVYNKDPRQFPDAKPIEKMTWSELQALVGDKWVPGLNAPFDPIATNLAKELDLTVIIANGKKFENLDKIVEGDAFKGTVIMPYRIDASFYDREYYVGKKSESRIKYANSFFGNIFHTVVNFYRAALIKIFINPKTCLDVGAGTGNLVKCLRSLGIDAQGVEISKDAIDLADNKIKPFIKHGDITNLPFEDNQFDLVVSYDVLEHIDRSNIQKAINETIRVSKKYMYHKIYTLENKWITWFHRRDFSHISVFTKKYWNRLFTENDKVSIPRISFFKLPSFFESIFILRKK